MAGLRFLVPTMLVRIQLGQQQNPPQRGGFFVFFKEVKALDQEQSFTFADEKKTKNHFSRSEKGFVEHQPPFRDQRQLIQIS